MSEHIKDLNEDLIISISEILLKKGLKATTMDSIAAALSMSKRTLYEIFDSKKDMIMKVMEYWQLQHSRTVENIFLSSETVMEALFLVFKLHQKIMNDVNVKFFRDMDTFFPDVRKQFERHDRLWVKKVMVVINKGIEQGVFRKDVNYPVTLRLMRIQMESIKRMEEFFPVEITIGDALDSISIGFLRSIASPSGMGILDKLYYNQSK